MPIQKSCLRVLRLSVIAAALLTSSAILTKDAEAEESVALVKFAAGIEASDDVSAIERVGEFLVVGADEAVGDDKNQNLIQVLRRTEKGRYEVLKSIQIFEGPDDEEEMDIEGIAADGRVVYVIGSHSRKRKKLKASRDYDKNRKRLEKSEKVLSRGRVYRLELTSDGSLVPGSKVEQTELMKVIEKKKALKPFTGIASKENGVDIEGLATDGEWLYAGFRGPVLREGYVPVLRFMFDDPADNEKLFYVNLGGRGIRSIAKVEGGFLIVAGPVGDEPRSFQLYFWDGKDMVPGTGNRPSTPGNLTLVTEISAPGEAKAEGLAVLDDTDGRYDLIIAFDGIQGPLALRYKVAIPNDG